MAGAGFAVTREVLDWLEGLAANGAFVVNADGSGGFSPQVDKLVRAMHTVLAGGDVDVVVKSPGDPALNKELDHKLDAAVGSVAGAPTRAVTTYLP